MLVILPVLLYLIIAFAILFLQNVKNGFGISWFMAAIVSLVVWGIVLSYYWYQPEPLLIKGWLRLSFQVKDLIFGFDQFSWQYAFALSALTVGVIFTAPARMRFQTQPWAWAGSLAITSAGFGAILAGNPITLVLAWTGLDLLEVGFLLLILKKEFDIRTIISFGARLGASMLVMWTIAYSHSQGRELTFSGMVPQEGLLYLLAVGLRLGIFPFYVPYTNELPIRRGLVTMLRLTSPLSSFVLLGRLVNLVMPSEWAILLSVFTALAALYGSLMWLFAKDELIGRPYWLLAYAGMVFTCVVRGQTEASYGLGIAMILNGAVLFLSSNLFQRKSILFIPLLSFIAISGLPFSPTSSGWNGLVVLPFNLLDIVFIIAYAVLLIGFLRHAVEAGEEYPTGESWIEAVFIVGLLFPILTDWIVGILKAGFMPSKVWWAGVISFVISLIGFWGYLRLSARWSDSHPESQWLTLLIGKISKPAEVFLRFDWLYRILWEFYRLVQWVLGSLTMIFEGQGGILWSLLLFMLLLFLVRGVGE